MNEFLEKIKTTKGYISAPRAQERWFKKNLPNELELIINYHQKYFNNYEYKFIQKIYNYVNNIEEIPVCTICKVKKLKFIDFTHGYQKYCSRKCTYNSDMFDRIVDTKKNDPEHNIKRLKQFKETMLKNHGVEFPIQSKEIKQKIENTNLERYNSKEPLSSPIIREKMRKGYIEKYGIEHNWQIPEVINKCNDTKDKIYGEKKMGITEKIKNTLYDKYGEDIECSLMIPEAKEKSINTSIKNWGHPHHLQNADQFNKMTKSMYKLKDYEMPSGRIVKVQGYEPAALDELFKKGYKEEDIIVDSKEIESYIGSVIYNTNNGKTHRYYPDIYIVSENKIIEVKSEYTYKKNKDINLLKMKSVLDKSINFEFRIL